MTDFSSPLFLSLSPPLVVHLTRATHTLTSLPLVSNTDKRRTGKKEGGGGTPYSVRSLSCVAELTFQVREAVAVKLEVEEVETRRRELFLTTHVSQRS